MPDSRSEAVKSSVENLIAEKKQIARQETALIRTLNRMLKKMGYHIVPVGGQGGERKKRGRRRGRKPGPKPGRKAGTRTPTRAVGRRRRLRKPGRPPKTASTTS